MGAAPVEVDVEVPVVLPAVEDAVVVGSVVVPTEDELAELGKHCE